MVRRKRKPQPARRLSVKRIERLLATKHEQVARYRDDDEVKGLYLQVRPTNDGRTSASWILRYQFKNRERMLGLGPYPDFSLKEARERARAARQKLADGIDPLDAKAENRARLAEEAAKALTFEKAAQRYYDFYKTTWKSDKVRKQFLSTLQTYAYPKIGAVAVGEIDTPMVLNVLTPIWHTIPETAGRIRGRIERVLAWATTHGYRKGDNPAKWRDHLSTALPKNNQPDVHHAALPYAEIADFIVALRKRQGVAARALEFTVLTAARTGEVINATWDEIDLKEKVWTISAARMKASREHSVPLSDRAVEILRKLPHEKDNPHVFIGPRKGTGLSNMAMAVLLNRRMGYDKVTVHGFRSSFRDWAAEKTAYPDVVVEMALAHSIGSAVEKAYRRTNLFARRIRLMAEWARYCETKPVKTGANVVPLKAGVR